jgi:hypothetical protein
MTKLKEFFEGIFGAAAGIVWIIFILSYTVGSVYWIWISIQLGSFGMFFLGIAGPVIIFTGPIGMYSLIFGTPDWIISTFS